MNIFSKSTESGPKIKYVEEFKDAFGNGVSKKAFRIKIKELSWNPFSSNKEYFTIPQDKDVADFCLVKFETKQDKHFNKRNTLIFLTELEEFYKLSKLDLAPALHQIRIDKMNVYGKDVEKGMPFPPTELSAKKTEISKTEKYFIVSYLVEMCGEGVDVFLTKYPLKVAQVGEKFNEFAEKMVNKTGTANIDLKPANMCAKYNTTTGEIESISLLDVDPMFSITSEIEGFKKHAKIFMNFLFFSFCLRYRKIKFPDWYLTKDDVQEMIRFFFAKEFTEKEHHPTGMLCHYLRLKCPTESADLIIATLKDQINEIPETTSHKEGAVAGPSEVMTDNAAINEESKGGKRKRKSKKRKNRKRKYTRKV